MTSIYRDIVNGTRELMSSVIDNRLNNVMKTLTIVTLVMGIPTLISGIYGMNVKFKMGSVFKYTVWFWDYLWSDTYCVCSYAYSIKKEKVFVGCSLQKLFLFLFIGKCL